MFLHILSFVGALGIFLYGMKIMSEGLENRIFSAIKTSSNLDEIYDKVKTKRFAHSRIRRAVLSATSPISRNT